MARHLLVTNDFPPKLGGIQNYLWELWRRLPPDSFAVYTTDYDGAATFDAKQAFRIERAPERVLGPYPWMVKRLNSLARDVEADLVLIDPALPLGAIGPFLDRPYGVVIHGAEVTIPGRLPYSRRLLGQILRRAALVVAAGNYPLAEAERCAGRTLRSIVVPPGVDHRRFRPYDAEERHEARRYFGLDQSDFVLATVNRLVPRKGMEFLVRAASEVAKRRATTSDVGDHTPNLRVLIGGIGRQRARLEKLISELDAPVDLLGRVADDDVGRLYGASDAMAMLCHDRWMGLEQEGFGIVFLEAAAAGLPQIAGRSGGADEAVVHGVTGLVVDDARDHRHVADQIEHLMDNPQQRRALGDTARERAVSGFDYDVLAKTLRSAIDDVCDELGSRSDHSLR